MDKKCHEILEQKMCKELEMIQAKYTQNPNQEMSTQDLERVDKLYHALKSMATYSAMKEAENYGEDNWNNEGIKPGTSEYRGRAMNGRFVSRESANSYTEGYSNGYSEAMNQMNGNGGNSNHYPMMPYPNRRW